MMKHGKCELCHAFADLRDSHYLPKSGYKKMRSSALKNPNPIVLSGSKAKQSSLQVRDYKFCGACEERFNKGGEAWILNNIPPHGHPFWVHNLLNSRTPIVSGSDLLFPQASIPEVDMTKLVYFALSIFWRGTRRWSAVEGGRPPQLYFGRYEEAIRVFLLGRAKLPDDVVVTVAVWPYKKVYSTATLPCSAGTPYRSYWFYFFGFIFMLTLGRRIPAQRRVTCSYHSAEKFLTCSLGLGSFVKETIRTQFLSRDRSKIEGVLKEIEAIRSTATSTE
jgi:hypothetical protein